MQLHFLTSGHILTWQHLLIRNAPAGIRFTVPIPVYLLEHEKGCFLFDTGQQIHDEKFADDANFIPIVNEEQRTVNLLKQRGIPPEKLAGIILSHHHSDHVEGVADFPDVPCIIRREEMQCTCMQEYKKQNPGRKWIHPDGVFDLCGDGRILCIPTPGHTPGHQSLLLTMDNGEKILLAADAAYTEKALEQSPDENEKGLPYWQTIECLKQYQKAGIRIITGHDPAAWEALQKEFP